MEGCNELVLKFMKACAENNIDTFLGNGKGKKTVLDNKCITFIKKIYNSNKYGFIKQFMLDDHIFSDNQYDSREQSVSDYTSDEEEKIKYVSTQVCHDITEECKVKLTDFGSSFTFDNKPTDEIQTRYYRAPEIILNNEYNHKIDVWALGCTIFELLTGKMLFDPYKIENCNLDREHLYKMSQYFGEIPIEIVEQSKRSKYLFESNSNKVKKMPILEPLSLKTIFIQYGLSEQDASDMTNKI